MTRLKSSPFLGLAMQRIRAGRPELPADQTYFTRVEKVPAGDYVEVWFRTGGCTWDGAGGCTMCNYGRGGHVSASEMVAAVRSALDELPEPPAELMVSPSGGMWDPKEVPNEVVDSVYEMVRRVRPGRFFVETRAETVSSKRVAGFRGAFPAAELAVEVGLESSHDGVLAYCVNKGSTAGLFERAAARLRASGIVTYANVCLGTALLDRTLALRDTLASTRWALTHGADKVVIFPLHVKPFTLLGWLYRQGS